MEYLPKYYSSCCSSVPTLDPFSTVFPWNHCRLSEGYIWWLKTLQSFLYSRQHLKYPSLHLACSILRFKANGGSLQLNQSSWSNQLIANQNHVQFLDSEIVVLIVDKLNFFVSLFFNWNVSKLTQFTLMEVWECILFCEDVIVLTSLQIPFFKGFSGLLSVRDDEGNDSIKFRGRTSQYIGFAKRHLVPERITYRDIGLIPHLVSIKTIT